MLKDIIDVQLLNDYKIRLRFEDGVEGVVDISQLIEFKGVFKPLADKHYFAQVRVNPELGSK